MKNTKVNMILLYILQAIPVPYSFISWIGTIMAFAAESQAVTLADRAGEIFMLLFFVFAGLYPLTYLISMLITGVTGRISWYSVLPLFHIGIFVQILVNFIIHSAIGNFIDTVINLIT